MFCSLATVKSHARFRFCAGDAGVRERREDLLEVRRAGPRSRCVNVGMRVAVELEPALGRDQRAVAVAQVAHRHDEAVTLGEVLGDAGR